MRRPSLLEFLILSVLLLWGIDLGVLGAVYLFSAGDVFNSAWLYLIVLWTIITLRLFFIFGLAGSFGLRLGDLTSGKLTLRGILLGIGIITLFKAIEIFYSGSLSLQCVGEFGAFQKMGGNLAFLLFASQYVYYFLEILAVNLLYIGTAGFIGEKKAILAPVLLWGALHVLNIFRMSLLSAILLGVYMTLFALLTYMLAYREGSFKVPVVVWLLNVIV